MFLPNTIEDILKNIRGDTEIIAILDGSWPTTPIEDHPQVTLVYHPVSIGQRAATNEAARLSNAEFVMKCDAHCAFDEGFDIKLMEECEKDWTVIPRMYNLHVFDWVCTSCGHRKYQGPEPPKCEKCEGIVVRDMVWKPRWRRMTDFARFDHDLHFQYWSAYKDRSEAQGDIADVMCSVGACWFMRRDRYWELGGTDEKHGSWGQMGVEMACKAWLSGGRQVVNKKTWFSHLFRTQPGFSFPYHHTDAATGQARSYSKKLWMDNTWPKAVHKLEWLIKKFAPVPDWPEYNTPTQTTQGQMSKGIVYYTDNRLDKVMFKGVQRQIVRCVDGHSIVSVSLKAIDFGKNIVFDGKRGILTMFKQILVGLETSDADIVFLCEHDILYHPSHFRFVPRRPDAFYYNENTWKVDAKTGQALFYYTKQTSGLCAYRTLLVEHYQKRVAKVESEGYSHNMGFEPGCHRPPRGVDNHPAERWMSPYPNIDLRHEHNLTRSRWNQDQFHNKNACLGWKMADEVPGWGQTKGRIDALIVEPEYVDD
jgi:glycosyltransferase involved in cell wall biosynthesis